MSVNEMKTISVPLKQNSYPIWIKRNILEIIDELLTPLNTQQKWFILSPSSVFNLYGKELLENLKLLGFNVSPLIIEDGEQVKSISHFENYSKQLVQMGCNRDSILIAFGGGVTGDLCGFIASSLFRGIDYIQIPTSLLAMVDSSIGGKTGINIEEGKNLIGAFHQPKAVIIDPRLIKTLPGIEIKAGLGEILKYGIIKEPKIIQIFSNFINSNLDLNSDDLDKLIFLSAKIKAEIVSQDSNENDLRRILNFGHTVGHIIESFTNYNYLSHGEAVAYGMVVALNLSQKYYNLDKSELNNVLNLLNQISETSLPEIPKDEFLKLLFRDKKVKDQKVNFVLVEKLGHPILKNDIDSEIIFEFYNNLMRSKK